MFGLYSVPWLELGRQIRHAHLEAPLDHCCFGNSWRVCGQDEEGQAVDEGQLLACVALASIVCRS